MYECVSTSDKISCVLSDCQKYNFVQRKAFKAGIILNISYIFVYCIYIYIFFFSDFYYDDLSRSNFKDSFDARFDTS